MSLQAEVEAAFAAEGLLSRAAEHYREREGQTRMALAVAQTMAQGGALVVEAGTGVGKTFAYLVPALLSGERVLLSTATKALQDQLYGRDLPRLVEALGLPVRTALLKGRGSYLCLQRLMSARHDEGHEPAAARALAKVERWAQLTRTGDLGELSGLDERSPIIPLITSTRENCLGAQCPQFKACHVNLARREALAADVVVINHHLFFADLAVRESGMAELLPSVRVVVFDEAHQLNAIGVQFLGLQLSTGQMMDLARDLLATGLQQARGWADWQQLAGGLERAVRDLRMTAGRQPQGSKLRWVGAAPEGLDPVHWAESLVGLRPAVEAALAGVAACSDGSPELARLQERLMLLRQRVQRFAAPCAPEVVRWVDVGVQLRLVESPLDIADAMRTRVLRMAQAAPSGQEDAELEGLSGDAGAVANNPPLQEALGLQPQPQAASDAAWADAAVPPERPRAWVFTSATLGAEPTLRWFTEPCGLQDASVLRVASPFDYAEQAALYVPLPFPKPSEPTHAAAVAAVAAQGASQLGGRTLVLTTTLRALRSIADTLRDKLRWLPVDVLVQGELPKRVLMERFRAAAAPGQRGCVLVASASFWEGFDAPGDALQLVVIDKLPFPPPGDPLVEARTQRLEMQGRSGFADFSVPEAAVALKQGAGRLIRRESDQGLLVVCDTRLVQMGYGKRLLAALPPMRRLENAQDYAQALAVLARAQSQHD